MLSALAYTLKVTSRVVHLVSMAVFFSAAFNDYLTGVESHDDVHPSLRFARKWSGILIMITGIINMVFIVKTKQWVRNTAFSVWKYSLMIKFAATVALSPLFEKIVPLFTDNPKYSLVQELRLYACLLIVFLTSVLRYFREAHFEVEQKVKYTELQ